MRFECVGCLTAVFWLFCWLELAADEESNWLHPNQDWETIGPPNGKLMIAGGSMGEGLLRLFLDEIGGAEQPLVLITTAAGKVYDESHPAVAKFRELGATNITVLHTKDRRVANSEGFVAPLRAAKGVFIAGGLQYRLAASYLNTLTHREVFAVLRRGGVVAGSSAGASIQGSFHYGGGSKYPTGFGLVRESAIGQHYIRRNRMASLPRILSKHPELLGIGIDEDTALMVWGDDAFVVGSSKVLMVNARSDLSLEREYGISLLPGDRYCLRKRQILSRAKFHREPLQFGRDDRWNPLNLHEGLRMNDGILLAAYAASDAVLEQFFVMAGGVDGKIVVLTTGNEEERKSAVRIATRLERMGALDVTLRATIDEQTEANLEAFVTPLRHATGVWIGEAAPWKLADSYLRTQTHKELKNVLARGGVVGAAGTAVNLLGSHMFGAGYRWNEGYALAADLFFVPMPLRKSHQKLMAEMCQTNEKLAGFGLPEGCLLKVTKDGVQVVDGEIEEFNGISAAWNRK